MYPFKWAPTSSRQPVLQQSGLAKCSAFHRFDSFKCRTFWPRTLGQECYLGGRMSKHFRSQFSSFQQRENKTDKQSNKRVWNKFEQVTSGIFNWRWAISVCWTRDGRPSSQQATMFSYNLKIASSIYWYNFWKSLGIEWAKTTVPIQKAQANRGKWSAEGLATNGQKRVDWLTTEQKSKMKEWL